MDSLGPAIFKQTRIGKDRPQNGFSISRIDDKSSQDRRTNNLGGRPFTLYELRTMYVDTKERYRELYRYEYSPEEISTMYFKIPDDPRLTRFGLHLRKTTLDELPTLINMINGGYESHRPQTRHS